MARKPITYGGTKDEILRVSKQMFFEKGFDGVTIRNIQREVGCEVGLFYYYFSSKDEVFDVVLTQEENQWRLAFEDMVEENGHDPRVCLKSLFECFFRLSKQYITGDVLHRSIRSDICERMENVLADYIEEILKKTGILLRISESSLSVILSGGIGKLIFGCSERDLSRFSDEAERLLDAVLPEYRSRSREISVELL